MTRLPSLLRPSLAMLWAFLAVALPALAALLAAMPAVDLAYQLRAGGEILDSRTIPSVDTWTLGAAGLPWTDQQWGAQVLLALVYRAAGWTGLAILRAALVAATSWLLLRLLRVRAPRLGAMGATLLVLAAFVVMATTLALRPQLFAIPLFVLTLLLLADRAAHPRRIWAIPLIALLWANFHGSFPLVLVVLGLALLADLLDRRDPRPLGVVTLASVAATLVNPFGLGVWTYVVNLASNPTISSRVSEWRPPTPLEPAGLLFYLSVLAVVALIAAASVRAPGTSATRRLPPSGLLTLLVFGGLAAYTGRGLAWWPPAALFVIAPLAADRLPLLRLASSARRSRLNAAVVVFMLIGGMSLLPIWRPLGPAGVPLGTLSYAPQGIAAALPGFGQADMPRGPTSGGGRPPHVWVPQVWASWFELEAPNNLYEVDSRIELYPAEFWATYDAVRAGRQDPSAQPPGFEWVVTGGAADGDLERTLASSSTWTRVFSDADGALWRHADPVP